MNKIPIIVSIIMLLLAIASGWSYGYYQILRFVVSGASAYTAYQCYQNKRQGWLWILGAVAVLFNPVLPIHMDKESWVVVDIVAAVVFGIFLIRFKWQQQ
jgi:hypothetical protein